MQNAIGVLGGTFNPIHLGHIEIAKQAMKECNLSKVIFLPNGNPPHKQNHEIASSCHRYNMIKLAIKGMKGFEISDYELQRKEPSYTIDTNRVFKTMYDSKIYFIIGADSFNSLNLWYNYEDLIKECSFIVAARGEDDFSTLSEKCREYNLSGGDVIPLKMEPFDAKSTDIRNIIKGNGSAERFLPRSVEEYIKNYNIYK